MRRVYRACTRNMTTSSVCLHDKSAANDLHAVRGAEAPGMSSYSCAKEERSHEKQIEKQEDCRPLGSCYSLRYGTQRGPRAPAVDAVLDRGSRHSDQDVVQLERNSYEAIMKNIARRTSFKYALGAGLVAIMIAAAMGGRKPYSVGITADGLESAQTPEISIRGWPEFARSTALMLIEEYGEPDQFNQQALVWYYNGPWQQTDVFRDAGVRHSAMRANDYVKQAVSYQVPAGKIAALKRFNKGLGIDTVRGEMSFQSESENMNFLALNLAEEIAANKRSVEDARAFYIKTRRLAGEGKSSPYLQRFLFAIPEANAAH